MTTLTINSTVPTRIFERTDYNIEIETALMLENYKQELKNSGKAQENIYPVMQQLKQVARTTDINNPKNVKEYLASENCHWNNKTKTKFCYNYTALLKFLNQTWIPPHYQVTDKLPFIPTEQEIDLLISACGKVTATALQMLKETGIRIGELTLLKWLDIDFERKTVNITPEKNSNGRILPINDKLIGMLNTLSRHHAPNVFQPDKHMLREYFSTQRKALAKKLNNPRLMQIHFHTIRHWKGTM